MKDRIIYFLKNHISNTRLLLFLSKIIQSKKLINGRFELWSDCNKKRIELLKNKHPDKLYVHQMDFMITERCSLKCKECSNLMQYYEAPKDIDVETLFRNLDIIDETFDEIAELRVLGGEPFMNMHIYEICKYAASKKHIRNIVVFSNATIIPRKAGLESLNTGKTVFYLSDYGNEKQKVQEVAEILKYEGIACNVADFSSGVWICHGGIQYRNVDEEIKNKLFNNCGGRKCPVICEDKIYLCEFICNAVRLKAVPSNKINYFEINYESKKRKKEINDYLMGTIVPEACEYCARMFYDDKSTQSVSPAIQAKAPLAYKKYE